MSTSDPDSQAGSGGMGLDPSTPDDSGSEMALDPFTAEELDRFSGTVRKSAPSGEFGLEATTQLSVTVPDKIARVVVDAVEDSLGGPGPGLADLAQWPPRGTDLATFTWTSAGQITSLTIDWDPVADPVREINGFEWQGDTLSNPRNGDTITERYSYTGGGDADIRTVFSPRGTSRESDVSGLAISDPSELPAGLEPGPSPDTIINGSVAQLPTGQVVGIVPEAGDTVYVDIVYDNAVERWTVKLAIRGTVPGRRPTSQAEAPFFITVDASVAGGIPPTRIGAFQAAYTIMAGESPTNVAVQIKEEIERNPEIANPEVDDDSDTVQDTFGALQAQKAQVEDAVEDAQQRLGQDESITVETEQERQDRERREERFSSQAAEERDRGQLDLAAGGQDRLRDLASGSQADTGAENAGEDIPPLSEQQAESDTDDTAEMSLDLTDAAPDAGEQSGLGDRSAGATALPSARRRVPPTMVDSLTEGLEGLNVTTQAGERLQNIGDLLVSLALGNALTADVTDDLRQAAGVVTQTAMTRGRLSDRDRDQIEDALRSLLDVLERDAPQSRVRARYEAYIDTVEDTTGVGPEEADG